eukprot:721918-Pyramimonas_sp.AAC.1
MGPPGGKDHISPSCGWPVSVPLPPPTAQARGVKPVANAASCLRSVWTCTCAAAPLVPTATCVHGGQPPSRAQHALRLCCWLHVELYSYMVRKKTDPV